MTFGEYMNKRPKASRLNVRLALSIWGDVSQAALLNLKELTRRYALSVAAGHLQGLEGRWYVTHSGLLRIAQHRRCSGMRTTLQGELSDPVAHRWIFKATIYKTPASKGFVGYGDADPSNVSPLVRGAEMRVAETRAVNRALRKAYGIGLCSVEEIGTVPNTGEKLPPQNTNGNGAGPNVRDRLCQIIRQHKLDAELVKAYAVDFCGTKTLREASREQVETFVQQLAEWAEKDRNALLCQLNSYARPKQEVVARGAASPVSPKPPVIRGRRFLTVSFSSGLMVPSS